MSETGFFSNEISNFVGTSVYCVGEKQQTEEVRLFGDSRTIIIQKKTVCDFFYIPTKKAM